MCGLVFVFVLVLLPPKYTESFPRRERFVQFASTVEVQMMKSPFYFREKEREMTTTIRDVVGGEHGVYSVASV
jgi:hypothetical protein